MKEKVSPKRVHFHPFMQNQDYTKVRPAAPLNKPFSFVHLTFNEAYWALSLLVVKSK